ncbi:MAG: hypothetical protein QXU98_10515 [Candidatus Parvarchaeota archaeon]
MQLVAAQTLGSNIPVAQVSIGITDSVTSKPARLRSFVISNAAVVQSEIGGSIM